MARIKWMNGRVGLILVAFAIGAMAVSSGQLTREIHNADQPFNFALVDPRPGVDDWPCWRGANGRNIALSKHFPIEWQPSNHDGWQVSIPGFGNAPPIIWGHQVFLTSYEASSRRILLNCLHRQSGRVLWQARLHPEGTPQAKEKSEQVASAPACDGQSVFIVTNWNEKLCVTAVDLFGQIVWQRETGSYRSSRGYSSSPVIYKSLIIVSADQASGSYLTGIHRQTGDVIWRVNRPDGESFGSPIIGTVAGRPQLILAGLGSVKSYDPATGFELWTCRTSTEQVANSVAFDDDNIFITRNHPNAEVLCINASGTGDITSSHIRWRQTPLGAEAVSPLYSESFIYVLAEDGRLTCVQASTGKVEWNKRLNGSFSASPVIVGNFLFCANESGETYFVRLGTSNPMIIENDISGSVVASPVFAGDSLFIRTTSRLHRIVAPGQEPIVEKPAFPRRL